MEFLGFQAESLVIFQSKLYVFQARIYWFFQDEEADNQAEGPPTEPTVAEVAPTEDLAGIPAETSSDEMAGQSAAKDEATDGGETTAGETSEEERPVTATLRKASGKITLLRYIYLPGRFH